MGGINRDDTGHGGQAPAGGNQQEVQQPADQIAFANGTVVTNKPKKKIRRGKKKKRRGGDGAGHGFDGHVTGGEGPEGGDVAESVSGAAHGDVAVGVEQNGHLNGEGSHGVGGKGYDYLEGGAVQPIGDSTGHDDTSTSPKQIFTISPDDWHDVDEEIPVSMSQLINGPTSPSEPDNHRATVSAWLNAYTTAHPTSISLAHRNLIIDHILNNKHPGTDPAWASTIRQTIWRTVIRASHFWIDPTTGETIKRILPVHRPDGIYESDFRVFLMCAAERADRIGRDLPTEEHVKMIETAIRAFLANVEKAGMRDELDCLGFLLMFDEEHRRVLGFDEMRERIRWAFEGRKVSFEGCEVLRARRVKVNTAALRGTMRMWEAAKAAL